MNFKYKIGQKVVFNGMVDNWDRGPLSNINNGDVITIDGYVPHTPANLPAYKIKEYPKYGIYEKYLFPIQEEKFPLISYSKIREEVLIGAN